MILPGVSGGYLLLLLGQYERILGTIDQLKQHVTSIPVFGNEAVPRFCAGPWLAHSDE